MDIKIMKNWVPPEITGEISHGDMPGDKVEIGESHIKKANIIFLELIRQITPLLEKEKVVISVCGGSGVGKSEIASLLSFYLSEVGIGAYTMSGDNYPHRIPKYNDAERLWLFRKNAIQGMVEEKEFQMERFGTIQRYQKVGDDANPNHVMEQDWYDSYLEKGRQGLKNYLGTSAEIAFDEVERIIEEFKSGKPEVWMKRMGREETELWYEKIGVSEIDVLIIEWTHGNSDCFQGVDIPILLNSTPAETLEHRRARNRDGATDSPFTTLVLELEQELLISQAHKAKIIVSKAGDLWSYRKYCEVMEEKNDKYK